MSFDFEKICRFCLMEADNFSPIFSNNNYDENLSQRVSFILPSLQICEDDGLPMQACLSCVQQVNASFTFKLQCENSDLILRKLIADIEENESKTEDSLCNLSLVQLKAVEPEITIEELDSKTHNNDEKCRLSDVNDETSALKKHQLSENGSHALTEQKLKSVKEIKKENLKDRFSKCSDNEAFENKKNLDRHSTARNEHEECILQLSEECSKSSPSSGDCGQNTSFRNKFRRCGKLPPRKNCVCHICGKLFRYNSRLVQHMLSHTQEKNFVCDVCGRKFSLKDNLKIHMRSHSDERPYPCQECGACFKLSGTLKAHLKIHAGEKPYPCVDCGKSFISNRDLKLHLLVHTRVKAFTCAECGKKFGCNANLKQHMLRVHTNDKPYECSVCSKRFSLSVQLKLHCLNHSRSRQVSCNQCGKTFINSSRLKDHMTSHSGKRPFSCEQCGKTFVRREHLNYHINAIHGK